MSHNAESHGDGMSNGRKETFITQKDFFSQMGIVWLFIMFSFLETGRVGENVGTSFLCGVSFLVGLVYLVQSRRGK